MNKKIVCVHLFNNYSGSPKVLSQVIGVLINRGYDVDLITNKTIGFLSNIPQVQYKYISYRWSNSKISTLLSFILAQLELFVIVIRYYKCDNSILYINTITPFGATIASKLYKKNIIYHVHENYINSNILNKISRYIYEHSDCYSIFVSRYLMSCYPKMHNESIVIYNTLDKSFQEVAQKYLNTRTENSVTILMVCSLRAYKGVSEFVSLSKLLPDYNFELVLSVSESELDQFIKQNELGKNIKVYGNQTNLHQFYQRAKLILNLTDPSKIIETFGLTILEAMEYGIPAIVPKVGGPTELVEDGFNGFLLSSNELQSIVDKIKIIMQDEELYKQLSINSLAKSKKFNISLMEKGVFNTVVGLTEL